MRLHARIALAAISSVGFASLARADATPIDELIVHGSRSTFAVDLDLAPLRIDSRRHRLEISDSVRSVLADSSRPRRAREAEVAITGPVPRG
jgi:hypothetical protein